MAIFAKAVQHLKQPPYSTIEYCGINRKFFPKWEGWRVIDSGEIPDEELVDDFYNIFFWSKLKCDEIVSQELAELMFVFSVANGKRKLIDKLDRVLGLESNGLLLNATVSRINDSDTKCLFLHLYSEFAEFCIMMDKKKDFCKLLKIYNKFTETF